MLWQQILAIALGPVFAMHPAGDASAYVDRAFPVRGETSYVRAHHDYPANDIFASCGRPVVAPVRGVVLEVSRVDRWDPATNLGRFRGGKFFSIGGADGVRYYGSHLARIERDIEPGVTVRAGQRIGSVGRTGSARFTPCHLHFGLSPVCEGTGQWWIRRGAVNPHRFLTRWESGGNLSPARAVAAWKHNQGCPAPPN